MSLPIIGAVHRRFLCADELRLLDAHWLRVYFAERLRHPRGTYGRSFNVSRARSAIDALRGRAES